MIFLRVVSHLQLKKGGFWGSNPKPKPKPKPKKPKKPKTQSKNLIFLGINFFEIKNLTFLSLSK